MQAKKKDVSRKRDTHRDFKYHIRDYEITWILASKIYLAFWDSENFP